MIADLIQRFVCRVTGKSCSSDRPSSSAIKTEMKERGRRVEARTVELRRQRRTIATGDFMEDEFLVGVRRNES